MNFAQCIQLAYQERRGNTAQCMRYGIGYRIKGEAQEEQLAKPSEVQRRLGDAVPTARDDSLPADAEALADVLTSHKRWMTVDEASKIIRRTKHECLRLLRALENAGRARQVSNGVQRGWALS